MILCDGNENLNLIGYVDANLAGDLNRRKYTAVVS